VLDDITLRSDPVLNFVAFSPQKKRAVSQEGRLHFGEIFNKRSLV
jgi:hypothetical protein